MQLEHSMNWTVIAATRCAINPHPEWPDTWAAQHIVDAQNRERQPCKPFRPPGVATSSANRKVDILETGGQLAIRALTLRNIEISDEQQRLAFAQQRLDQRAYSCDAIVAMVWFVPQEAWIKQTNDRINQGVLRPMLLLLHFRWAKGRVGADQHHGMPISKVQPYTEHRRNIQSALFQNWKPAQEAHATADAISPDDAMRIHSTQRLIRSESLDMFGRQFLHCDHVGRAGGKEATNGIRPGIIEQDVPAHDAEGPSTGRGSRSDPPSRNACDSGDGDRQKERSQTTCMSQACTCKHEHNQREQVRTKDPDQREWPAPWQQTIQWGAPTHKQMI